MSLAVLHTEASCGWGGQEIRILTEMEALAARGHRVRLVAPGHAPIVAAARARHLPVDAVPIEFRTVAAYRALCGWLDAHGRDLDVINTHSSADSWLVALAGLRRPWRAPLVRTRHVSTRVNRSRPTRWLYQRATAHIVVTGEALSTQLQRDNGFDPARLTSVRTGIDLERFAPRDRAAARYALGLEVARPTLAIVATLRDWKGHDDLLDVWPVVREQVRGWQILVVGDGPRRAHLEARVATMGLAAEVRFAGQREDVEVWFAAADLVALPSWGEEGVPQSLLQAAACARPAVSTTIGAIGEAVRHGETGLLVPPRDRLALTDALVGLMRDEAVRVRMGAAGRVLAEQQFSVEAMASAMLAVYARVLGARR
ncbi:MAG: glycosyltransferase family 4 protein [Casimicrobiaceae bacterium]